MRTGAVALIDALGFRGIWARQNPQDVLTTFQSMKTWMEERVRDQFASQPHMQCEIAFLSDTIVVSMSLEEGCQPNREAMSQSPRQHSSCV
jgi:hypothetical protein